MCEFQVCTYECRGDGYVWDADMDGYDPEDHSWPCPCCNTLVYLEGAKEDAESTSYYSSMGQSGTGVTIWESAVRTAREWNPHGLETCLVKIGRVAAAYDDENAEDGVSEKIFLYETQ